jgi:hypothetical protein
MKKIIFMCFTAILFAVNEFAQFKIKKGILTRYIGSGGDVVIPKRVKEIGGEAFSGYSSLTAVTIPDGVTWIGEKAFNGCSSLTAVTIPGSVTTIGWAAFSRCKSLTAITVENGSSSFSSIDGVLFGNAGTVLVQYPPGRKTGHYDIPNSVTSIGTMAFFDCYRLTSVTIPDGVTEIGRSAFNGCSSLTSVTIPGSVTEIEKYAFSDCSSLISVTIPNSVTVIEKWAFSYTSLTDVTVGWEKPLSIGGNTFEDVPLASCTLHVSTGTKALYESADVWKKFGTIVEYE